MNAHTAFEHPSNILPLVVGIDLGGTQIRVAVLQGSNVRARVSTLTGEDSAPERVLPRMFQTVEQALHEAGVSLDEIAGIGIGAPGPLNGRTGVVFSPPNLAWRNVPLRDIFVQHFNKPIFVENDANAAALGEYMFGAGRGSKEMAYVTISTGIGAGVIADGRILTGIAGTAAELGHMTIDWHGERCNCGNIGCLESISSGTAIARSANKLVAIGKGQALLDFALAHQDHDRQGVNPVHITARTVAHAAEAGITEAQKIIARAAEGLGFGLVNLLHIFNPELVILGGSVTQIGAPLLEPAMQIVRARAMQVPRDSMRLVIAELGADVGLIGAGALNYYHLQQA